LSAHNKTPPGLFEAKGRRNIQCAAGGRAVHFSPLRSLRAALPRSIYAPRSPRARAPAAPPSPWPLVPGAMSCSPGLVSTYPHYTPFPRQTQQKCRGLRATALTPMDFTRMGCVGAPSSMLHGRGGKVAAWIRSRRGGEGHGLLTTRRPLALSAKGRRNSRCAAGAARFTAPLCALRVLCARLCPALSVHQGRQEHTHQPYRLAPGPWYPTQCHAHLAFCLPTPIIHPPRTKSRRNVGGYASWPSRPCVSRAWGKVVAWTRSCRGGEGHCLPTTKRPLALSAKGRRNIQCAAGCCAVHCSPLRSLRPLREALLRPIYAPGSPRAHAPAAPPSPWPCPGGP
jgi:hypothetical protein